MKLNFLFESDEEHRRLERALKQNPDDLDARHRYLARLRRQGLGRNEIWDGEPGRIVTPDGSMLSVQHENDGYWEVAWISPDGQLAPWPSDAPHLRKDPRQAEDNLLRTEPVHGLTQSEVIDFIIWARGYKLAEVNIDKIYDYAKHLAMARLGWVSNPSVDGAFRALRMVGYNDAADVIEADFIKYVEDQFREEEDEED